MDGFANVKSEFVEWSQKAEELGEPRTNGNSEEGVPDEKSDNGVFGDVAFFPGDFGMGDVGDNGGDGGGDGGSCHDDCSTCHAERSEASL